MPLKTRIGTDWVVKPLKWWNGTAWAVKPLKRWDGTSWALVSVGATFVASASVATQAETAAQTLGALGAQVGDIALCVTTRDAPSTPGGAWNSIAIESSGGVSANAAWRVLTAADIAGRISTPAQTGYGVAIYRGAASAQFVKTQADIGTTAGKAGVSKAPNHAGFAFIVPDVAITGPGTWAQRANSVFYNYSASTGQFFIKDRLVPPNADYVDGTAFVFGSLSGTPYRHADLLEFLF